MSSRQLVIAAKHLRDEVHALHFAPPVDCVYNPLDYAWAAHELYLKKFGDGRKRVIFLGMNPGPFGMVQTGVPFGEIPAVRDWLGIVAKIGRPDYEHPKRPIKGFDCKRSEISGQRLWNFFAKHFRTAENFFAEHFVVNYCPLAFLEKTGRNLTPNKLPAGERDALFAICDEHLRAVVETLKPEWIIGIGDFAAKRAQCVFHETGIKLGQILHPSPASPVANRNWGGAVEAQLRKLGVWK